MILVYNEIITEDQTKEETRMISLNDPMIVLMLKNLREISPKANREENNQIKEIIRNTLKASTDREIIRFYNEFCAFLKKLHMKYNESQP
jgi:hypothetical protein